MNIIQSYWSKPFYSSKDSSWERRKAGGWRHRKFFYMSWALSSLLLKNNYGKVSLMTDSLGAEILGDTLKLPFDNISTELDVLCDYHEDLWAVGKIYTYGRQDNSFLHFDSDVFVWEKFDNDILNAELIAQNIEINFPLDKQSLQEIYRCFELPTWIQQFIYQSDLISSNAGILGGRDATFFQEYSRSVLEIIEINKKKLPKINLPISNTIFEQYLFTCHARRINKPISYFLDNIENKYLEHLCNFQAIPFHKKYIHIIGPYKRMLTSEMWLEERLLLEFPEYYYRIINLLKQNRI